MWTRQYRNGNCRPNWTCRIRWFDGGAGGKLKLEMLDEFQFVEYWPKSVEEADQAWAWFKHFAPHPGQKFPVVQPVLDEMYKQYASRSFRTNPMPKFMKGN